jgi:hypothetical protein
VDGAAADVNMGEKQSALGQLDELDETPANSVRPRAA